MSTLARRQLPQFITGFAGALIITEMFLQVPNLSGIVTQIITWGTVMSLFALLLGVYNIVTFHYGQFKARKPGEWYLSLYALFLFVSCVIIGLASGINSAIYTWLWFNLSGWLYMCSLGIQGLYMLSGAYRAMRARSIEAGLFLTSGVIVILAQIPLAGYWWPWLVPIQDWMVRYPVTGAMTGIGLGASLGSIALAARTLYGRERVLRLAAEAE